MTSWQDPPPVLSLLEKDIHIWLIPLTAQGNAIWLSADEQQRAKRIVNTALRQRFIAARTGLRTILAGYTQQAPQALQFNYAISGKPFLSTHPQLQFNLSHSGELAVCAVAQNIALGIDLEYVKFRANLLFIAKRHFATEDYAALLALPAEKQTAAFYRLWTHKEARLKAVGGSIFKKNSSAVPLTLHDFVPAPQYTAALALSQQLYQLSFYRSKSS